MKLDARVSAPAIRPQDLAQIAAKVEDAAVLLKALSNAPRLLILCHLMFEGELMVGDIVKRVGLSQSALSQHLARLKDEGLVVARREARTLHYRIADPRVGRVLSLLQELFCHELAPNGSDQGTGNEQ